MTKYNRLCVSVSDNSKDKLELIINNSNIRGLTKSAIVDMALIKFFETIDADSITDEISKSLSKTDK